MVPYLLNQLDAVVPLERLDGHSSAIDQLCQVDGLAGVHPSQIHQVLQALQRQGLVLRPPAGKDNRRCQLVTISKEATQAHEKTSR